MAATLPLAGLCLQQRSAMSSSRSSFTARAPLAAAPRRAVAARRGALAVRMSAAAPKVDVVDFAGTPTGQETLELNAARPETAKYVVHRAVVCERANKRQGSANTKTRSEVRGGGKKPLQQKGSGRARQGSKRTPLRPGGGVTFGPKPKDWSKEINKKEKRLAISTALQSAAVDMTVVEDFEKEFADKPSTGAMSKALASWGLDKNSREHGLLITNGINENVWKSARNISNLTVLPSSTLNVYDICRADKLFVARSALEDLRVRYPAKTANTEA